MLVMHVLGDCPSCRGKDKFGNVMVSGNHVLRGCMSCQYSAKIWLPETRKKIVYLDQFFFSHAFRDRDQRFIQAAERIRQVAALQLLAVPYSSIHEDETHLWRGCDGKTKDDLMAFIKATSRGHEFEPAYKVEERQIIQGFQAFLQEEPDVYELQERDVINGNIHEWDNYFRIDVGGYLRDIELARDLKRQSVERLVDLFPEWRTSSSTLHQDISLELHGAVKGYLDSYITYAMRLAHGDYNALFDSPIISGVVEALMYCLPEDMPPNERLAKIGEYFKSNYFSELPSQWLSARIFAVLKHMVRHGAYTDRAEAIQRLSGFFLDVKHVSTYAPYCDAFVMDQGMAALVSDQRIALENRYGVKVFSLNTWADFMAWLDTLEDNMTQEHRDGLAAAYP